MFHFMLRKIYDICHVVVTNQRLERINNKVMGEWLLVMGELIMCDGLKWIENVPALKGQPKKAKGKASQRAAPFAKK